MTETEIVSITKVFHETECRYRYEIISITEEISELKMGKCKITQK